MRGSLLDSQTFLMVVDFGELPVFQSAATFPGIFVWKKQPRKTAPTLFAEIKDLSTCYAKALNEHISRIAQIIPASQFTKDGHRLAGSKDANLLDKFSKAGVPLQEFLKN